MPRRASQLLRGTPLGLAARILELGPSPQRALLERLALRGTITILFTDIAGFTSTTEARGERTAMRLIDAHDRLVMSGIAGRFRADVRPGESVELTLALPPLRKPGLYALQVDMEEEQHCPFHQAGSEPLDLELEVP